MASASGSFLVHFSVYSYQVIKIPEINLTLRIAIVSSASGQPGPVGRKCNAYQIVGNAYHAACNHFPRSGVPQKKRVVIEY